MNTTKYDEKLKPIFEYVENGNYNAVKKWLDDGNPVFNPESKTKSVLYYAATNGFFSILELLVQADWKQEPTQLNLALAQSIKIAHVDCTRLLLENGADAESISWYSIFNTHNSRLASLFFEYRKDVDDFENAMGQIERGTAGAIKNALPAHPEFEIPILKKMLEYLSEMEYYSPSQLRYGMKSAEEQAKQYAHYGRLFGLLRWTGVDVRKQVTDKYDNTTSILKDAVESSKLSIIKSLGLTAGDPVNDYAKEMSVCDEAKLKYLIKLGLIINDQADGTSLHLLNYLKQSKLSIAQVFIDNGAKLPPVENKEFKNLRYFLFHQPFPDGIFLALAKILSTEQMKYLLTNSKVKEVLGDTPDVIIRNLYDPANSESPDRFDLLMEEVAEELKLIDVHPVARKYRGYCIKSDRTPDPFPNLIPGRNHDLYSFSSLHCSKKIRPWIIMILNKIVPELEKQGGKFEFEEKPSWGDRIGVNFCVNIQGYKIPLEFHEAEASPKKYLARNNANSAYVGKLQFCHRLHGQKVKLAEEKTFLGFKDRIDYLVTRVISVADSEDRQAQERREANEKWERERREQAEKEQQKYQARVKLENQRAKNKQKVQEMIQEEQDFFKDISKKAKAFEDCRIMRQYLTALKKEWLSSGDKLSDEQKTWLFRAELLLKHHDPFQKKTPQTIQDIEFPESLWDCQWAEIEAYIAKELKK